MLDAIRKRSGSIVVKGLLLLLVLSFGIWGVGDYINSGGTDNNAAVVGDIELPAGDIEFQLNQEIQRLGQRFGGSLSPEMVQQLRSMGLVQDVLRRNINQALFTLATQDLGMVVTDDRVRADIQGNDAFRNDLGRFDRQLFEAALRSAGFSEATYVSLTRGDIARALFLDSVLGGVRAPKALTDVVYRFGREGRIADTILVTDDKVGDLAPADDTAIAAYHQDHPGRFTAPEYRKVTAVVFTADDLAKEIEVPETDLQAAYNERLSQYTRAERRTLQQIYVADEARARELHAALLGGADFVKTGEAEGLVSSAIELGTVTETEFLPALAGPAFALSLGGITEPVKSTLGWHILKVTAIEPGGQTPFEQVKDALAAEIAHERAVDGLYDLSTRLEDALGGGATLEEASRQLGLRLLSIPAVDATGLDPDGEEVGGLPAGGKFLDAVFAMAEGEDGFLTETGADGYFVARVDGITPPALRPLETVKDEVVEALMAERKANATRERAEQLAEKVRSGGDLAALAAEAGLEVKRSEAIMRNGQGLPSGALASLFGLDVGGVGTAVVDGGAMVIRLVEVINADPAANETEVRNFADQLRAGIETDLVQQLTLALQQEHGVTVNQRVVARISGADQP